MRLLDNEALERSSTVANCQMNRHRSLTGSNGYAKEIRINPLDLLLAGAKTKVRWLDLCCGEGKALVEAARRIHDQGMDDRCEIVGVDMVVTPPASEPHFPFLQIVEASLTRWHPVGRFDLITSVHGLHYVGDKLEMITRAVSWLTDNGHFMANLDLRNIKLTDGRSVSRVIAKQLRAAGLDYDPRNKLLRCHHRTSVELPFRYCGADDQAGPNYTKQSAVDSYYEPLT